MTVTVAADSDGDRDCDWNPSAPTIGNAPALAHGQLPTLITIMDTGGAETGVYHHGFRRTPGPGPQWTTTAAAGTMWPAVSFEFPVQLLVFTEPVDKVRNGLFLI